MSHHFAGAGDVGVPLKSTVSNCDSDRACPTLYLLRYRYFNLLYYYRPGTLPSPLAPPTTNHHPVECLRHWFCARSANVYYFSFCHLHLAKAQRVSLPIFFTYLLNFIHFSAATRGSMRVLSHRRGRYSRAGQMPRTDIYTHRHIGSQKGFLCYVPYVVYVLL